MSTVAYILVGFLTFMGIAGGSYVTWKVAKRGTSGDINTTDAAKLWEEGTNIRKELRAEVQELRVQVERLEKELETSKEKAFECQEQYATLQLVMQNMQRHIEVLEGKAK